MLGTCHTSLGRACREDPTAVATVKHELRKVRAAKIDARWFARGGVCTHKSISVKWVSIVAYVYCWKHHQIGAHVSIKRGRDRGRSLKDADDDSNLTWKPGAVLLPPSSTKLAGNHVFLSAKRLPVPQQVIMPSTRERSSPNASAGHSEILKQCQSV